MLRYYLPKHCYPPYTLHESYHVLTFFFDVHLELIVVLYFFAGCTYLRLLVCLFVHSFIYFIFILLLSVDFVSDKLKN